MQDKLALMALFTLPLSGLSVLEQGYLRPTSRHTSVDRPAPVCLKELAAAEFQFRDFDVDGDRYPNFWRADIAGLYALAPGGSPAIKLASLSIASADDSPTTDLSAYSVPSTHGGYWFRAIRHLDETPSSLDRKRFAFCAYPDSPSAGRYLYVIDERNVVYRSFARGLRGIWVFPSDEELLRSWTVVN